ncbi:glycosyltransferase family 9 protein [Chlorobium phaeovibrioides]|nr:glycosyltransferase family 9 protein [Chlorobium phaeovibrioides]
MAPLLALRQKSHFSPQAIYVLLQKPLGLGDLLMLSPFLLELSARSHALPVFIVTEYPEFFTIPNAQWIGPEELTAGRCEHALVLSPTLSWKHARYLLHAGWVLGYFLSDHLMCNFTRSTVRYNARQSHYFDRTFPISSILDALWASPSAGPEYPVIMQEPFRAVELPETYCCIAPYSNWPERQYPKDSWAQVIKALQKYFPVVLIGGRAPAELAMAEELAQGGAVNLVGRTTIAEVAGIIAQSRIFLGNDAGLSHIAVLSAPASVVIFGCVGGKQRIPLDSELAAHIRVLGGGSSCSSFPCYNGFSRPVCNNHEQYQCLGSISPEAVVDEALSLIEECG